MSLIMGLNTSVKGLVSRFEQFESNIEVKVNKLQSEFVLLRNKVDFIESNRHVESAKMGGQERLPQQFSAAAVGSVPSNLTTGNLSKFEHETSKMEQP